MKILVVESNLSELSEVTAVIGKLYPSAQVLPFSDGMKAVQYGSHHTVHMVFSAVQLPHLTGFDVVRLLRTKNPELKAFLFDDTDKYAERAQMEKIGRFYRKTALEKGIWQRCREKDNDCST